MLKIKKITHKQQKVLNMISRYIEENGYPPTIRDIGKELKLTSTSTVHSYLNVLKSKGYVTWEEGRPRTLKILERILI